MASDVDKILKDIKANSEQGIEAVKRYDENRKADTDRMIAAQKDDADRMIATQEANADRTRITLESGFYHVGSKITEAINVVGRISYEICTGLNAIQKSLSDQELTQAQGLTRRAAENIGNGFYIEARKEIQRALEMHETNPLSWYLLGATYLPNKPAAGCPVEYDEAIKALSKASRYIAPYACKDKEAKQFAAQIELTLGLVQRKYFDELRVIGKTEDARPLLAAAQKAFDQSTAYSAGGI